VCCRGVLHITDMDRIELSNLNRQFLFRRRHIGSSKATVASNAGRCINNNMNIKVYETRVEPLTESIFNDGFWESLDIVVNALDNIKSRQYVDGQCVWYRKPLLESGTLGTKGNVQVQEEYLFY
jgi:ubiquitin-activating enzyme E1